MSPNAPTPSPRAAGILAAAPSPLRADGALDPTALPALLDHLARSGCHGVLLLGSTGEGPSFTLAERRRLLQAAIDWRAARGAARPTLLAGTGCPSLGDTIEATRQAFALGVDGVLVLPPYYFSPVSDAGLEDWFGAVLESAVPPDGQLYLYHIPRASRIALSTELIVRLARRYPGRLAGVKDSGADLPRTLERIEALPDLAILTGSDDHLLPVLEAGGAGAITALANLCAPRAREVWEAHRSGDLEAARAAQARLTEARHALDAQPTVAAIKAMLPRLHGLPSWPLRAPLEALRPEAALALEVALRRAAAPPSDRARRGSARATPPRSPA